MKRTSQLFPQIPKRNNLRLAFYRAARGKRDRSVVRQFAKKLDRNLENMSEQLLAGVVPVGQYRQFVIRDPKERVITAPCFSERVLHHAIINICEPYFERWLIKDTYACRRGKGREAAINRASVFSRRHRWFSQLDVRKYFDNISHQRLLCLLRRRFKDLPLLALMRRIIVAFRGESGRGLPIGSLTSQHFANLYLGHVDRYAKEQLQLPGYVRYMDDMVLWHDDRKQLERITQKCTQYLKENLDLDVKPPILNRTDFGINFLGCRVFPTHTILSRRSRIRWRRKLQDVQRQWAQGLISEHGLQQRLNSLTAFGVAANTQSWHFRSTVLEQFQVDDHERLEPGEPGR
ncbi:MAG: RNA-directed DNA polymerase [Fuerstiella sp.]|nr:RNA-directed DNA polymerase [Fuerstiella sp.]